MAKIINDPTNDLYKFFRDPRYEDSEFRNTQVQRYYAWWDRSSQPEAQLLVNGENYVIAVLCEKELDARNKARKEAYEASKPLIEKIAWKFYKIIWEIGCKVGDNLPSNGLARRVTICLFAIPFVISFLVFKGAFDFYIKRHQ